MNPHPPQVVPHPKTAAAMTAVRVSQVTKSFGSGDSRTVALKGVDFSCNEAELHLVVGPSGCGKTTLLSVVAGTLEWEEGEIEVFGTRLKNLKPAEIARFRGQTIGFIFQQFNLIPTLSVLENVSIPLLLNGRKRLEAEHRAQEILKEVGLGQKLRSSPRELSGGQQQRVAIARALVHHPRLIICDEPTSALDSKTGHVIMELLASVARVPGRSVIIVTHDPRTYAFADRITEMEDGKVLKVLAGEDVRQYARSHH